MARLLTVAVYLAGVVAALALVGTSRLRPQALASVTDLLDAALVNRAVRVTLIVFWWWLGWHFLVGQTVGSST